MKIVLALGGNALLARGQALTAENQIENIKKAAHSIAKIARDHELVIVHGNGPQVGLLMEQNAAYYEVSPETTPYPMDVLGSQTCGMVGYMLSRELKNQDEQLNIATLITQTVVSDQDPAFANPTKFVGPVYSKEAADKMMQAKKEIVFKEDGEYFRRVVPSPKPFDIIELDQIKALLNNKNVVIAGGGGGVPVKRSSTGHLDGVECVIDKDLTAELLAEKIEADLFIILTDGAVCKDFGKPTQQVMKTTSPKALAEFDFPAGSMGPKIDAVCRFVNNEAGDAAIGSLFELDDILEGKSGTLIQKNAEHVYY